MQRLGVLALDQGTTSTRALVIDELGGVVTAVRREHTQYFPRPGWVEHDPAEIWTHAREVLVEAAAEASASGYRIAALGVTNQRETTVVWDRRTGEPIGPAIVWQDVRAGTDVDEMRQAMAPGRLREVTGLPPDPYFSGFKLRWLLRHDLELRLRAEAGEVCFGTVDSWLVWNLTGGGGAGVHVTDVTNASRTALMDLRELRWSAEALEAFGVPEAMLPRIVPSSGVVGRVRGVPGLHGVPLAGVLGDQQAAAFGQAVFEPGQSKCTYGTGSFLLVNTGESPVRSSSGLIGTVAYQLEDAPARYALEGAVSVAGSLIQWMRDTLGIIANADEVEALAASVPDSGGAVIVPAFQGLLAPHWSPDATGAIMGLTRFTGRGHLARAALEAVAFQTCDIVAAMEADLGTELAELRVDGGMAHNRLLLQIQADLLGLPVVRPRELETTALGAGYAAGLAVRVWESTEEISALGEVGERSVPTLDPSSRQRMAAAWASAVARVVDRPLVTA